MSSDSNIRPESVVDSQTVLDMKQIHAAEVTSAAVERRELSANLLAELALDDAGRAAVMRDVRIARLYIDQASLGPTHLLPSATEFFTTALRDRYPTINYVDTYIMAGYLVEDDSEATLRLAHRVAREIASILHLDPDRDVLGVRVVDTNDINLDLL